MKAEKGKTSDGHAQDLEKNNPNHWTGEGYFFVSRLFAKIATIAITAIATT